jgi:predicted nucleic acid-binding protein
MYAPSFFRATSFAPIPMSFTLDTNILIYSADRSDASKHALAERLVARLVQRRGAIPLQCLNEFYRATTKKRLLTKAEASAIVERLLLSVNTIASSASDSREAMRIHDAHTTQFFDALLLATSTRAGCTIFLSEDLQDGQTFGALTVRNPFKMTGAELATLLA